MFLVAVNQCRDHECNINWTLEDLCSVTVDNRLSVNCLSCTTLDNFITYCSIMGLKNRTVLPVTIRRGGAAWRRPVLTNAST